MIGEGALNNGLYTLQIKPTSPITIALATQDNKSPNIWHNRLGHLSNLILSKLFPDLNNNLDHCESCVLGKQCRIPFAVSNSEYNMPFLLVHSYVWTSLLTSYEGFCYFVSFINLHTHAS